MLPIPASLPGQAHFCSVVFLHSGSDPFTATQLNVDLLTLAERKVAQKNLHIVQFSGLPPSTGTGMWARLDVAGHLFKEKGFIDLFFDLSRFAGRVSVVAPRKLLSDATIKAAGLRPADAAGLKKWLARHRDDAKRLQWEGKFPTADLDRLLGAMKAVEGSPLVTINEKGSTFQRIPIGRGDVFTMFLRIDPPKGARLSDSWPFSVVQRESKTGIVQGGADYLVKINRPLNATLQESRHR